MLRAEGRHPLLLGLSVHQVSLPRKRSSFCERIPTRSQGEVLLLDGVAFFEDVSMATGWAHHVRINETPNQGQGQRRRRISFLRAFKRDRTKRLSPFLGPDSYPPPPLAAGNTPERIRVRENRLRSLAPGPIRENSPSEKKTAQALA